MCADVWVTHTHTHTYGTSLDPRERVSTYLCVDVHVCMLVFRTHTRILTLMAPAWTLEKGCVCTCVRAGVPGTSSSNSPASLLSSPWLEEASLLGVSFSAVTLPPSSSSCSGSLSLGEVEWNAAGLGVTSWLCGPASPFPSLGFAFRI